MLPLSGEVRRKGNHVGKKPQFRAFQILITACTCWMLFFFFFFTYLTVLGPPCFVGFFPLGATLVAVHEPLISVAPLVVEHGV